MDVSSMLMREWLVWSDVDNWGGSERVAVIIGKPFVGENKRLVLTLQLVKDKSIRKFGLNRRSIQNLADAYGTESDEWLAKKVRFDPYVYATDKTTIEIKAYKEEKL